MSERPINNNKMGHGNCGIMGNATSNLGTGIHGKAIYFVFLFCDGHTEYISKYDAATMQDRVHSKGP
jgi:prepilin-type processing-associated H-X9-DG protein